MDTEVRQCTRCKKYKPIEEILTKRVQFITPGHGYKVVRTRTVARLCAECRDKDPAWNQRKYTDAVGY